jgi:hypothetical protein
LSERSAYLYREGDRYWFSTQPTLNRIADERAKDVSDDDADAEIIAILRKDQAHKGSFHRVHGAPDNPIDVEDSRSVALVILSPAHNHALRSDDPTSAERIITDAVQRRGSGQRRFRNSLVFVAADEAGLASCREIARKYLAWRSIVEDEAMAEALTRAQSEDASSRMQQAAEGLVQRIRSTWSHVIYPVPAIDNSNGTGAAMGFAVDHVSIANRAPRKPIPQVVYDKLKSSGVIVDELGPDTLLAELRKIWREDTPHVAVATLLDWFASYVYLSRLREEATLTLSIEKLVGKIESPVAFAKSFDEATGKYIGATQWSTTLGAGLTSGLLVSRKVLPAQPAPDHGKPVGPDAVPGGREKEDIATDPTRKKLPRRFYGSITLDPDKAGLQVAKIAKEILFELTRPNGASVKISLEIEGAAASGYPEDVVEVVRANLRDLKLDITDVGFEEE